jgi:hypothetical protein
MEFPTAMPPIARANRGVNSTAPVENTTTAVGTTPRSVAVLTSANRRQLHRSRLVAVTAATTNITTSARATNSPMVMTPLRMKLRIASWIVPRRIARAGANRWGAR